MQCLIGIRHEEPSFMEIMLFYEISRQSKIGVLEEFQAFLKGTAVVIEVDFWNPR